MTTDPRLDHRAAPACRTVDPEIFFPVGREDRWRPGVVTVAKAICHRCPLQVKCLDWAIDFRQTDGILGGLTPAERRREAERRALLDELLRERSGDVDELLRERCRYAGVR